MMGFEVGTAVLSSEWSRRRYFNWNLYVGLPIAKAGLLLGSGASSQKQRCARRSIVRQGLISLRGVLGAAAGGGSRVLYEIVRSALARNPSRASFRNHFLALNNKTLG